MTKERNQFFMERALQLADKAAEQGEVPIGALIVLDDEIIAEGWNQSIGLSDPCAHAEIQAIRAAAQKLDNYRLPNTHLYVTLEPCSMCAGAMIHARIKQLTFGAFDEKAGAVSSVHQLIDSNLKQHCVQWQGGLLQQQCSNQISAFFKRRRAEKKSG